ncbi:Long-chain-fatty-acid--CoA ligase 4 [Balamuthia mandrillaris]
MKAGKKALLEEGKEPPLLWRILLFNRLQRIMGGNVRAMLSGGAPLSPSVHEFLMVAMGCPLVQAYGATESATGATMGYLNAVGSEYPPLTLTNLSLLGLDYYRGFGFSVIIRYVSGFDFSIWSYFFLFSNLFKLTTLQEQESQYKLVLDFSTELITWVSGPYAGQLLLGDKAYQGESCFLILFKGHVTCTLLEFNQVHVGERVDRERAIGHLKSVSSLTIPWQHSLDNQWFA